MELWIRSQDRKNLIKVNQICVDYQDNKQIIANCVPDFIGTEGSYYESLGKYETEERALEVLDEIEKFMANNSNFKGTYKESDLFIKSVIASSMVKIYNMPKE